MKAPQNFLGYSSPQDAIGKTIIRGEKKWDVIGVINNYHQKSLRYPIEPTMLLPCYSTNSSISVKVDIKDLSATIAAIKKIYDIFFPGNLFDYSFLDEKFNKQYSNDQSLRKSVWHLCRLCHFYRLSWIIWPFSCLQQRNEQKRLVSVKFLEHQFQILYYYCQKILSNLLLSHS